jgi:hypothetical protein
MHKHSDKVQKKRTVVRHTRRNVILAIVIVLIAILAYFSIQPAVPEITYTKTMPIQINETIYFRLFNTTVALKLQNSYNSGATFYISSIPILYSQISVLSLTTGSSANISSNGSKSADMNIKLVSSNSKGATVDITPLLSSLGIRVSGNVTVLNPVTLNIHGVASNISIIVITSTTTSTSISSIQNATVLSEQQAMAIVNKSAIGILMSSYKTLYNKDVKCNASVYNETYNTYYHILPGGLNSYANVSQFTPTDITTSISQLKIANNFGITYSTVAPSTLSTGPALMLIVNISSNAPLRNVTFMGIFKGDNYTRINDSYTFQSRIMNFCGAYIPKP